MDNKDLLNIALSMVSMGGPIPTEEEIKEYQQRKKDAANEIPEQTCEEGEATDA